MNMPTLIDVARLAEVSETTVARVVAHSPLVSEGIQRKVREAIAVTGFAPGQLPRREGPRRNPLVAILDGGSSPALRQQAMAGASAALAGSALGLCLKSLDANPRNLLRVFGEFLETHRPSAVVLLPPLSGAVQLAGLAWEYGCACARIGFAPSGENGADWLALPERRAAREAVHWLAQRGHHRIGLIAGPEDDPAAQEREAGFGEAMAELGLGRGLSLIAPSDGTFASAREATGLLLDLSPAPSALIAASDTLAAAAIRAAGARGLAVPGDLALVALADEHFAAMLTPPPVCVRVPCFEIVRDAVLRLTQPDAAKSPPADFPVLIVEPEPEGSPSL